MVKVKVWAKSGWLSDRTGKQQQQEFDWNGVSIDSAKNIKNKLEFVKRRKKGEKQIKQLFERAAVVLLFYFLLKFVRLTGMSIREGGGGGGERRRRRRRDNQDET